MNAMKLLLVLGNVEGCYIMSAEDFRQGKGRRVPSRRLWLIAAAIALSALLVGCAVAYALRLERLKVGTYHYQIPTEYDAQGNPIPHETHEPLMVLSLQGSNLEALAEWTAFTGSYDPDLSIAMEADRTGSAWEIPDNYHLTYGCYSQEMVDKLEEIAEKYRLKLLSAYIPMNWWESSALLKSLSLDSLTYDDGETQYWDGFLHPEGTFSINLLLTHQGDGWRWEEGTVSYRYSRKDYFDPLTSLLPASRDYRQWDYTRGDGKTVLLVLGEKTARLYADLPEALVSITLEPRILVEGERVPMTAAALEELAEVFDLDARPQPCSVETVEGYREEARAQYEAQQAAARQENPPTEGYAAYAAWALEQLHNSPEASYILWDVNGDGVEELVINGYRILSQKAGQTCDYFDLRQTGVMVPRFSPCQGRVFGVWCEDFGLFQYAFYEAGEETATFLTGVTRDDTGWYRMLSPGSDGQRTPVSQQEAREILDAYELHQPDWLPLARFGEDLPALPRDDPYGRYIARALQRYENAQAFTYTLMDINEDGTQELITREEDTGLHVYTIREGALWNLGLDSAVSHICQGGILEVSDEGECVWEYYRCTPTGVESVEKLLRDPYTLYWSHASGGGSPETVTKEAAMAIRDSYRRLKLEMKPFGEYPLS